jgi:hypothetical protein
MSTLPDVDKKAKEIDSCARRFEQAKVLDVTKINLCNANSVITTWLIPRRAMSTARLNCVAR